MTYFPVFHFVNNTLFFYFIRIFVHLFVLLSLFVHQLLFKVFIDPYLSIPVYLLCSFILFIDGFCLFFYKKNKTNFLLNLFLLFTDALFLSGLVMVMGPSGLFFIFLLAFIQTFPLFLLGKTFQPFVFLLYLSILLPIAFLWEGKPPFETRLSLVIFVNTALLFIFCSSYFFNYILKFLEAGKDLTSDTSLDDFSSLKPPAHIGMSLDLARKLKPVLNSLIKHFPENKTDKEKNHSVSASLFSLEKGRHQLKQIQNFISSFIEYAEPETDSLLGDTIDLKKLLINLLKKLKTHPQRPENLIQKTEFPVEIKIKGSIIHLKKCFEQILINSFEALKNQDEPEIHIQAYLEKSWVVLEFSDNGHGIESEDIKKLFDPLFSKRFGLKGLGLPYVQKIVKSHKAFLDIKSSKKGTKVIIKFPLNYDSYDSRMKKFKQNRKKAA